jgi:CubicO group peptidase (beta-lactamase class C family)
MSDLSAVSRILKDKYGEHVPGMIFSILKDGKLFESASFGNSREADSPELLAEMNSTSMIHAASVAKLLAAVAVLKFIEVWNQAVDGLIHETGELSPRKVIDADRVNAYGKKISLDTKIYDLIGPYLTPEVFGIEPSNYPGANVKQITIRHLLNHDSGLGYAPHGVYGNYNGISKELFDNEFYVVGSLTNGGKSSFDAQLATTNLFVSDSLPLPIHGYRGENSIPLSFLIEAFTGMTNGDWMRELVVPRNEYSNIDRSPNGEDNLVRYYGVPLVNTQPTTLQSPKFASGVMHPDYANFPCVGGWYMSSFEACHWIDDVMQRKEIDGFKILNDPRPMFRLAGAFEFQEFSGFKGFAKNGRTTVYGGTCNAKIGYFRKGASRFSVFMANNGDLFPDQPWSEALTAADDFIRNAV